MSKSTKSRGFKFLISFNFLILICFLFIILSLRPVPSPKESNTYSIHGIMEAVHSGGVNDAVFKLRDDKRRYYINRGLENGLNLAELHDKLLDQKVELKVIKHWTPLDWSQSLRSIAEIRVGGEVFVSYMN